jgi:glycosyltransferase involved in cell wall biosynthesis
MTDFDTSETSASLLQILALPVYRKGGRVFIDDQAANGLHESLRHFSSMTICVRLVADVEPPSNTVPFDTLGLDGKVNIVLLPVAWRPIAFLRTYPSVRRTLGEQIDRHRYLKFGMGGAWGDWGAIGALIAARRGRKAAVWTDRVESEVMRIDAMRMRGVRRLTRWSNSRIAWFLERWAIRRSTVGLFHGKDTFEAYRKYSAHPFLVHDIHLKASDRISPERLAGKIAGVGEAPLDIIYLGRLHPDKGVMDWIEALRLVAEAGLPFRARWFGEGPELEVAQARVASLGLSDRIQFPGTVTDRPALLEELRAAHLMVFCHLTPESPRCLIEALISGTPIVGYSSAYSEDLIDAYGGGVLVPMDPAGLAREIIALGKDRAALAALISRAAQDGHDMNDEAVFAHRSDLIKRYT